MGANENSEWVDQIGSDGLTAPGGADEREGIDLEKLRELLEAVDAIRDARIRARAGQKRKS